MVKTLPALRAMDSVTIRSITRWSPPGLGTANVPDNVHLLPEPGIRPRPGGENSLPSVEGQDVRTGASAHSPESEEGKQSGCSWNNWGLVMPLPHQAGVVRGTTFGVLVCASHPPI